MFSRKKHDLKNIEIYLTKSDTTRTRPNLSLNFLKFSLYQNVTIKFNATHGILYYFQIKIEFIKTKKKKHKNTKTKRN